MKYCLDFGAIFCIWTTIKTVLKYWFVKICFLFTPIITRILQPKY